MIQELIQTNLKHWFDLITIISILTYINFQVLYSTWIQFLTCTICVRNVAHLPRTCTRGWCMVGLAFCLFGENLLWRDNGRQGFDVYVSTPGWSLESSGLLLSVSTFWDLYALNLYNISKLSLLFLLSDSRTHDVKGWLGLAVEHSKYLIHIDFCWVFGYLNNCLVGDMLHVSTRKSKRFTKRYIILRGLWSSRMQTSCGNQKITKENNLKDILNVRYCSIIMKNV